MSDVNNEQRFKLLFENMNEGFSLNEIITDAAGKPVDFRILEMNAAYEKHTGLKGHEAIGKTIREIMPSADSGQIASYGKVALTGEPVSWEYRSNTFGRYFKVKAYCPQPGQFATIFEDITDRIRAQESVERAKNELAKFFDLVPDMVCIASTDGYFKRVNKAWSNVLGFTEKELLSIPYTQFMHPDDVQPTLKEVQRQIVGFGTISFINRYRTKDGDYRWFEWMATPADGDTLYAAARDITDHKKFEEILKESEEKYRSLYENTMDGVLLTVPDGGVISANEAACRMFQKTEEEICESGRHGIIDVTDPRLAKALEERARTGRFEGELTGLRADGTKFPVNVSTVMFKDKNGNQRTSMLVRDMTKLNELEKERQKMAEQLIVQDRLATVGQLASGIAHEMNNPLTSVIGFSELLLNREDIPADIKNDLEIIFNEAQRTSQVVKGLLTFARKQQTDKQASDIADLIKSVLQLRAYEEKVNNIEVEAIIEPDLPAVMGNIPQLQQVFINLIVNAEQAILETKGKGKINVSAERDGTFVKITVCDNGPGIKPENTDRIFTPFFTTKPVGKGTGLGLSICHGIISDHGGTIKAESEFGKGACFTIRLPMAEQSVKRRE